MGRVIDADALKKDLTRFYDGEVVARKLIDEQPTVDAVPVVRCRDCKYRDRESDFCYGRGLPVQLVPDDGFCDKGKGR